VTSVGVDALFAQALDQANSYRQASAERLIRSALSRLSRGESARVSRDRLLLTLANVRAERGGLSEGLAILDDVAGRAQGHLAGLVHSQRGLMLMRTGQMADALAEFTQALPLVQGEPRPLAVAHLNRGIALLSLGRLSSARTDFERCIAVATGHELGVQAGRARLNVAYLLLLAGDLPLALMELDAARQALRAAGDDGVEPIYRLDRARILHAAGLLAEADVELGAAVSGFRQHRSMQDQGECELARAMIALTESRFTDARLRARSARRLFDRRGSSAWSLVARLTELRAAGGLGRGLSRIAVESKRLAEDLGAAGLPEDARVARLLSQGVRARGGRGPKTVAEAPALVAGEGILTRLYAREVRSRYAMRTGEPALAAREVRAGLRELHRYQASFGSLDLQTAVVRHGRALAAMGLGAAVAQGTASSVFAWSERARATASRLPPVRPPDDPEAARLLEELRYVRTEQRAAALNGRDDAALRHRRAELERLVRQRSWYTAGAGEVEEPVSMARLRRALAAEPGATFVAHMVVGSDVHALVVTEKRSTVVALGPVDDALQRIRRLRADLDALALRQVPEPIRRSVSASVARGLDGLQERLWLPLKDQVGDGPAVLVPSGPLVAGAWTMLPALVGRPVTLARSATAWLRAHEAVLPMAADATRVVLAAGPDLARAPEEVSEIAQLWSRTTSFVGQQARGAPLLAAADGADVVHVAAHGVHEAANPLFAALRLADGPLFGYDLARMHVAPRLVVLSACELGQVTERPGDEVVGLTAALLHQGVGAVVSSVAKVSDDVAFEVTLAFHQGLRRGEAPSVALAAATEHQPCAPFVVFGAGW
jgi:tetratricopeptide (TPR) repeat protein